MKINIINDSEVSRLSVAIHMAPPPAAAISLLRRLVEIAMVTPRPAGRKKCSHVFQAPLSAPETLSV